jgi:hypothetical protein
MAALPVELWQFLLERLGRVGMRGAQHLVLVQPTKQCAQSLLLVRRKRQARLFDKALACASVEPIPLCPWHHSPTWRSCLVHASL